MTAGDRRPRVGVDVTPVTTGRTGVARYVLGLVDGLRAQPVDLRLFAYGRGPYLAPDGTRRSRVPVRVLHPAWQLLGHPRAERLVGPVDVAQTVDLLPAPTRAAVAVVVHDLVALELPHLHTAAQRAMQERQLAAARRADLVLVTTEVSRVDLERRQVSGRVVVAPCAPTPVVPRPGRPVDGPFVLAVGEQVARKDLPTLVRAFRAAGLAHGTRLVLAGPPGPATDAVRAVADDRVLLLGAVDDATLAALYRDALVLATTSLAEGFNIPTAEAMAAGVPVVASDLPVSREVGDGAFLLAAPGDVDAFAAALGAAVLDEVLRDQLVARGRVRAAELTWARTGATVAAAYAELLR